MRRFIYSLFILSGCIAGFHSFWYVLLFVTRTQLVVKSYCVAQLCVWARVSSLS